MRQLRQFAVVVHRFVTRHPVTAAALAVGMLATLAMCLPDRGLFIADARHEHSAAPWQFLRRHASLWDDFSGAGEPTQYYSPVVALLQSALAALQLPAWLIGRLTLAAYLTVAGSGAAALASRLGLRHWQVSAVGALYAFCPFSSQFLMPSGLYLPAALLPWLMTWAYDGLHGSDERRTVSWLGLGVFAAGLNNGAALGFVALPVILFMAFTVADSRVYLRRAFSFGWRAVAVSFAVSAAMLVVLKFSVPLLERNLRITELPRTVAATSSAGESWRGLGQWLSYFGTSPSGSIYLRSRAMILATYAAPTLAMVGLVTGRIRLRRVLGVLLGIGVLVMVGAHRAESSPLGTRLLRLFEESLTVRGFRTTYKMGSSVALLIAIFAIAGMSSIIGAVQALVRCRRTTGLLAGAVAGLVGLGPVAAATPFATGSVFASTESYRTLPPYWSAALSWFRDKPTDDRVLVLPGLARARYTWGFVNDNLFDAFLAPQALMSQTLTAGTRETATAIDYIERILVDPMLDDSAIQPMLAWLGVDWVLVQNDLVPSGDLPTPGRFNRLDHAPGITSVATFGTTETGRAAVEVYRVENPIPKAWSSASAPTIVMGEDDALASLGRQGWLEGGTVLLSSLDDAQLNALLRAGADVVVTDGSRRRAVRSTDNRLQLSATLPAAFESSKNLINPTSSSQDQTVATYGDLRSISVRPSDRLEEQIWDPPGRAANAFDRDQRTAWLLPPLETNYREYSLTATLRVPTKVTQVRIVPFSGGEREITRLRVELLLPGGEVVQRRIAPRRDAVSTVSVDEEIEGMTITVEQTSGTSGSIGITDIELITPSGRVDGREFLRMPTSVARLTGVDPTRLWYSMGTAGADAERTFRRQFTAPVASTVVLRARIRPGSVPFPDGTCLDVFSLDRRRVAVRVVSRSSTAVDVEGCAPTTLRSGAHTLQEVGRFAGATLDVLVGPATSPPASAMQAVAAERPHPWERTLDVPAGARFVGVRVPADAAWRADGSRIGMQFAINGQLAWQVTPGDPQLVTASYRPQDIYQVAALVTALSVGWCLLGILRRRPR